MREVFKNIVKIILRFEARLVLRKYKPNIIAITGNVGKTSTKNAITAVLSPHFFTRGSIKSYNSALGMPLAIIGRETAWSSWLGWLKNILAGFRLLMKHNFHYPEVLVLEAGVDRPHDMSEITNIITPNIAVMTALGTIPVHVEFFSGIDGLIREKAKLVKAVPADGLVVLNYDDFSVLEMKEKSKASVVTFGFADAADIRASDYKISLLKEESGEERPEGVTFKLNYEGNFVPVRLSGCFGKSQVYAALAAAAVGIHFELNLVDISEALSTYTPPPGRLRLLRGLKDTLILDDTYNASPTSVNAALDVLDDLPAGRKILVLGDMLELGKYTMQAHQEIGARLKGLINILIPVGLRAKFVSEEARAKGFSAKSIFEFSDAIEAGKKLQDILKPGDLILVKGSQSMRLEKVVQEVMAEPERAEELLVRQDEYWKGKPIM